MSGERVYPLGMETIDISGLIAEAVANERIAIGAAIQDYADDAARRALKMNTFSFGGTFDSTDAVIPISVTLGHSEMRRVIYKSEASGTRLTLKMRRWPLRQITTATGRTMLAGKRGYAAHLRRLMPMPWRAIRRA